MSNDETYLNLSRKNRLSADILFLMLKGAGYAAAVVVSIVLVIVIVQQIGLLLPEDSKTAPDPINRSSQLETVVEGLDVA
jgi:hypothetical protein